jgi:preprotein translocase SecF subunit
MPDAAAPASAPFTFSRWRWVGFGVTLALTLATLAALVVDGLAFGLDFTGGVIVEARSAASFDAGALRAALAAAGVPDAVVQLGDGGGSAFVRAPYLDGVDSVERIREALGAGAEIRSAEAVGPKVSGELLRGGAIACLLAVAGIAIYVWLRFEAKFGVAAFLTTLHDVVMIIGLFAVTGMTFDLSTVAAMLAVAGYSINDTVVVFDRIRETLGREPDSPIESVIDRSITETLRRTLMTSVTTLVTTVALMVLGGPVLFGFAAAITFGVLIGTYSSIFVAAPLLIHLPGRLPGRGEPDTDEAAAPAAG